MSNLASDKIFVFPAIQRTGTYENSARNLTEKNIVGLINKILDNGATFVISDSTGDATFDFMIWGYYFSVTSPSTTLFSGGSTNDKMWASIEIAATSGYEELSGTDGAGGYSGVSFVIQPSAPSGTGVHSLLIAEKTSNGWVVPLSSMFKYDGSRVYGTIDGNEA